MSTDNVIDLESEKYRRVLTGETFWKIDMKIPFVVYEDLFQVLVQVDKGNATMKHVIAFHQANYLGQDDTIDNYIAHQIDQIYNNFLKELPEDVVDSLDWDSVKDFLLNSRLYLGAGGKIYVYKVPEFNTVGVDSKDE